MYTIKLGTSIAQLLPFIRNQQVIQSNQQVIQKSIITKKLIITTAPKSIKLILLIPTTENI